jgi:hypothetical protein
MPQEVQLTMWEYCKLYEKTIYWLAAHGLFADKRDDYSDEGKAWDRLSKDGWELVTVTADQDGKFNYFFKRPRAEK